jgi:iron-sulfur cluster repair protein YtfE (RIC family)
MKTKKIEITKNSVIGDVIKEIPGAEEVIKKYFGNGCFTCPGINVETLTFGAAMHNVDPERIVEDINRLQEADSE